MILIYHIIKQKQKEMTETGMRKIMKIAEGTVREEYIVTDIQMEENIMRRLEALGINSGTRLKLMNRKKNGTVIIKVRGTRWAVGRDIAEGIEVRPQETEEKVHGKH